jgi:hypothetical protein
MFRRIAAAALIAASLTSAACAASSQLVCSFSDTAGAPKFIYVFEATVEGLSEMGSSIDGTVTLRAAKDRPQWKQIDHPGQGVSFISPDGDGFNVPAKSALALGRFKGALYTGGCHEGVNKGPLKRALFAPPPAKADKRARR